MRFTVAEGDPESVYAVGGSEPMTLWEKKLRSVGLKWVYISKCGKAKIELQTIGFAA